VMHNQHHKLSGMNFMHEILHASSESNCLIIQKLIMLSENGDYEGVKHLLEGGADVNVRDVSRKVRAHKHTCM
jgi:hypothetical protein